MAILFIKLRRETLKYFSDNDDDDELKDDDAAAADNAAAPDDDEHFFFTPCFCKKLSNSSKYLLAVALVEAAACAFVGFILERVKTTCYHQTESGEIDINRLIAV